MNTTPADPSGKTVPNQPVPSQPPISTTGSGKEGEPGVVVPQEQAQHAGVEVELPKEVMEAGVEQIGGTIELPPDIKKLGVTVSDTNAAPPAAVSPLPKVILPISDDQIVSGLHQKITNSILWMAVWCVKQLKKAHIVLKVVHGKVMRVKDDAI